MELTNKRIAVTGGAGFIGSHVVDQLAPHGNEIIIIDNFSTGKWENISQHGTSSHVHVRQVDILDLDTMLHLTRSVDVVFHLAVACLRVSINDPLFVHETNTTGTLNVCESALLNNAARFIYVSSSEAYGSATHVPMDEEHPLNPTTVYGASKAAGELYALAYWRTYGLPVVVVRPFNSYGPREPTDGTRAEVLPKFVMRAMAGLPPAIFGTGAQTRDFTWVEDVARGLIMAAECDALVGQRVNIARGEEISIERLCRLVLDRVGRPDLDPFYVTNGRPGDVERHCADISKAQRLMDYSPTVDIAQGIDRYVSWVKERNPDLVSWLQQEEMRNW